MKRHARRIEAMMGDGIRALRSKRGSFAVYAAIFFVPLASLAILFLEYSKTEAVKGAGAECGLLCASSILGEYDRNLAERYGIYGYYGSPAIVEEKLDFYMNIMTEGKRYLSYEGSEAELAGYVLTDPTVFRKQVIAMGKLVKAGEWKDRFLAGESQGSGLGHATTENGNSGSGVVSRSAGSLKDGGGISGSTGSSSSADGKIDNLTDGGSIQGTSNAKGSDVVINNQALLHMLPSYGKITESTLKNPKKVLESAKNSGNLKDLMQHVGEAWLEDEYALHFFQDARRQKDVGTTYFTNEVEYLLAGKTGDEANRKAVMRRIVAAREICNLVYLEESPEMQEKIHAVAFLISPQAEPAVAQLLAAGWALAESYNDYQLLLRGKKVPLWKDAESWALSLEQIMKIPEASDVPESESETGLKEAAGGEETPEMPEMKEELDFVVNPGNKQGETYEDYLQFLLALMKEPVKLYRMMDLMQINMQWNYSKYFFLKDHYAGVAGTLKVNGNAMEFQKDYQA